MLYDSVMLVAGHQLPAHHIRSDPVFGVAAGSEIRDKYLRVYGVLRPPDLILQGELHLISGPLRSMVGLYESVVDELCSWEVDVRKVRPKVVASTATIRRTPDLVQKLFVRKLEVFPPQGTGIRDSFFAIQRPTGTEYPGRRYLGNSAFGQRYPVALIRSFMARMASAQVLYDKYDSLAFW
jgi:hypothetical protein